jgi:hypothetical protein
LCILLHASFTAAQDHLLLSADSRIVDFALLGTYVVGAGVLIAVGSAFPGSRRRTRLKMRRLCMTTTLDLQVSPRLKRPGCRRRDFDALDARACADNGPRSPADGSFQSRARRT